MEVINPNAAVLSNFEVLKLLKEIRDEQKKQKRSVQQQQHLATISYETSKYLENTCCKYQTVDIIKQFMEAIKPFKLTKAEKLQLLNQRPTTAVEIQIMIDESEDRLTEEDIEKLLHVIAEILPDDSKESETTEMESEGT